MSEPLYAETHDRPSPSRVALAIAAVVAFFSAVVAVDVESGTALSAAARSAAPVGLVVAFFVGAAALPRHEIRVERDGIYYRVRPIQRTDRRVPRESIVDCTFGRTAWPGPARGEVVVPWGLGSVRSLFRRASGVRVLRRRGPAIVFVVDDRRAFTDAVGTMLDGEETAAAERRLRSGHCE